jgi:hypothetical protein
VTRIGELGTTLAVSNYRLTVRRNTNVVASSPILATMMTEALRSSDTSVLSRAVKASNLDRLEFEWFRRWITTLRITALMDSVHRQEIQILDNTSFRNLDILPSVDQGKEPPTLMGP